MNKFKFSLIKKDNNARAGLIQTSLGEIKTPAFMPVATQGAVKSTPINIIEEINYDMILSNTYHILLRPGLETLKEFGNLSKFMNWNKPILTDSGGFQVMSLSKLRKIDKNGVTFQSHIDGSSHRLTPENVVDIQNIIGSNIQMVLDECTPYPSSYEDANKSMLLSLDWAERARKAFLNTSGRSDSQFGIVQGSTYEDLRIKSALETINIDFEGYAVGGLAVGEGQEAMFETLEATTPLMQDLKPRYLMGVGKPSDLVGGVSRGIDMFDCVLPTRSGRTGQGFTRRGPVNLKNARHAEDPRPLDEACICPVCTRFSRAYLHHLFKAEEVLSLMLLSWHNIYYYQDLMREMQRSIDAGRFAEFEVSFQAMQAEGDIDPL